MDKTIGPLPILILFISMTILSIFLDEVGFFKYLALKATKKAKGSQYKIFIYLYLLTSILTIFTSNDIIILTFTPFICYFSRNAKINPVPYLLSEFVAANTWSMMLLIGNPTNIYISTSLNIDFFTYLKMMFLPTLAVGIISFILLMIIFHKQLQEKINNDIEENININKTLLIIGLIHLSACIALLTVSSYINIPMWKITAIFAISLLVLVLIYFGLKKEVPTILLKTLKRAPVALVPFLLSMFTFVYVIGKDGYIEKMSLFLMKYENVFTYGLSSFIFCNLVNNIPMSVLFAEILNITNGSSNLTYAVIASSNIGAYLTPIGALAGIMWMGILKEQNIKFSFAKFFKYGICLAVPSILVALAIISII